MFRFSHNTGINTGVKMKKWDIGAQRREVIKMILRARAADMDEVYRQVEEAETK